MMKIGVSSWMLAAICLLGCSDQATTSSPAANDAEPETQVDSEPEQEVAQVGVGDKGRNYGGGMITEPASQYWQIKERIAFEIQIPKALQLYKANNNGNAPKSHEEFMEKIIKEQRIELPTLPPGREYLFDPETELLMVQRQAE